VMKFDSAGTGAAQLQYDYASGVAVAGTTAFPGAGVQALYVVSDGGAEASYILFIQSGVSEGPTVSKIGQNTTEETAADREQSG
jgi:hypothetical protein